jgi:hypothetical protein
VISLIKTISAVSSYSINICIEDKMSVRDLGPTVIIQYIEGELLLDLRINNSKTTLILIGNVAFITKLKLVLTGIE